MNIIEEWRSLFVEGTRGHAGGAGPRGSPQEPSQQLHYQYLPDHGKIATADYTAHRTRAGAAGAAVAMRWKKEVNSKHATYSPQTPFSTCKLQVDQTRSFVLH